MSAKEELIERVKTLTEEQAKIMLEWVEQELGPATKTDEPVGAAWR